VPQQNISPSLFFFESVGIFSLKILKAFLFTVKNDKKMCFFTVDCCQSVLGIAGQARNDDC